MDNQHVLDKRTNNLNNVLSHIVTFVARNSPTTSGGKTFPGHAYAIWQKAGAAPQASGFYPLDFQEDFAKIEWQGTVVDEFKNSPPDLTVFRLDVHVDQPAFDHSLQAVSAWDQKTLEYNLFTQNCNHFVHDVAAAIGLQAPNADTTLPRNYIENLWNANR